MYSKNCDSRSVSALILAGISLMAVVLYVRNPEGGTSVFPPCPFHYLTHLYCPGCGTLRACHQLLHGHLVAALQFNPLFVVALPVLAYFIAAHFHILLRGRGLPTPAVSAKRIWMIFGIVILYGILRNVPIYPFTLLAPHGITQGSRTELKPTTLSRCIAPYRMAN